MSQTRFHLCCDNPTVKIGVFQNELLALFCKEHLKDDEATNGSTSMIDIPQEEKI